LGVILGGGMSSRLFESVRERHGLAYYVWAGHDSGHPDSGSLAIVAGITIKKVDFAIKLIMQEIKNLTDSLVPAKELKKAKQALIGRLVLRLESSNSVAGGVASMELLHDKIETVAEIKKQYRAVTSERIQKLAKKFFKDEQLVVAVIGRYKNPAKIKAACQL